MVEWETGKPWGRGEVRTKVSDEGLPSGKNEKGSGSPEGTGHRSRNLRDERRDAKVCKGM